MKRILAIALVTAAAGSVPAMTEAAPATGMPDGAGASAAMGHGTAPARSGGMNRRRGDRCVPMVHDIYWLDYSRMGWRMRSERSGENAGRSDGDARTAQNAQSGSSGRMGRRMRVLRLKHNGFPPRERGGCPSCRARAGGMGQGGTDMAAAMKKRRWQRSGMRDGRPDPSLRKAVIWLETPDNLIHRIDPGKPGVMKFNARMWGLHKVFAYLDAGERNGVKRKYFAFYDLFSHGDDAAEKERPVLDGNGYWKGQPEFQLERIYENDQQRYRTQTGETARFRLTFRGKPVKGACVVMITQKNWRNAKKTDENGEVGFFLIKETPNESGWRARRRTEKYLVVARHFVPDAAAPQEGGRRTGTRYMATRMLRVRPSRLEWESKSTAFIVGSFTVVAAGAAIAIRRSRRRRRTKGAS